MSKHTTELLNASKHACNFWLEERVKIRLARREIENQQAAYVIEQMDVYIAHLQNAIDKAEGKGDQCEEAAANE